MGLQRSPEVGAVVRASAHAPVARVVAARRVLDLDDVGAQVAQQMAAARKALDKAFFAMVAGLIADGHTEADAIAELLVRFA